MTLQDEPGFARARLAAMPALDEAPELYAPLPALDDPTSRAATRDDADFAVRAGAGATALAGRLRDESSDIADGLTADRLSRYDAQSAALLEGAPSVAAEDAARAAIDRARGRLADAVLPQEAAARTVARRQGLIDALALFRQDAEADPDAADGLYAEGAAAIADAAEWLGESEAQQLEEQWRNTVYESSLIALANRDLPEAINQVRLGKYAMLAEPQRNHLIKRASLRADALAADDLHTRQHEEDRRDLQRQSDRWKFHADFIRSLRDGSARFGAIYQAFEDGQISGVDRDTYEARLRAANSAQVRTQDRIESVNRLLDGDDTARPSSEDIGAHYERVMNPIIEQTPSEDRGRVYLDYLRALRRHDVTYERGTVDTGLPPPTDAAVTARQMDALLGFDPNGKGEVALSADRPLEGSAMLWRAQRDFKAVEELFAGLLTHNTPADAYRHAYWSFMATRDANRLLQSGHENVKMFTDAHEVKTLWQSREDFLGRTPAVQPAGEKYMDLYNNAAGRQLALDPANASRSAHDVILQALEDGKLQTKQMTIIPED